MTADRHEEREQPCNALVEKGGGAAFMQASCSGSCREAWKSVLRYISYSFR